MKQFLNFLNGKKTVIATIYWCVITPMLQVWYPDGVPSDINKIYLSIGFILTAFGIGHKISKAKKVIK